MKLKKEDFRLETEEYEVEIDVKPEFEELLARAGYSKNQPSRSETVVQRWVTDSQIEDLKVQIIVNDKLENIESINQRLKFIEINYEEIKLKISNDLISMKNKNWLNENENPISIDVFSGLINLRNIEFSDDSILDLSFNDGDLFGGHDIRISLNDKNELSKAEII